MGVQVKGAMKRAPSSAKVLLRCFNARQFGLKLIANVTYGYTAAGFSGQEAGGSQWDSRGKAGQQGRGPAADWAWGYGSENVPGC